MTHPRYAENDPKAGQPVLVGDEWYNQHGNKNICLCITDKHIGGTGGFSDINKGPFFSAPPAPVVKPIFKVDPELLKQMESPVADLMRKVVADIHTRTARGERVTLTCGGEVLGVFEPKQPPAPIEACVCGFRPSSVIPEALPNGAIVYQVCCHRTAVCGRRGPACHSPQAAIAAWNADAVKLKAK
jgi:hypothetical protein